MRNVCENRGGGGEFPGRACRKNQIFYLTALLRNLAGACAGISPRKAILAISCSVSA